MSDATKMLTLPEMLDMAEGAKVRDPLGRTWVLTGGAWQYGGKVSGTLSLCCLLSPLTLVQQEPIVWRAKNDGWLWRFWDGCVQTCQGGGSAWTPYTPVDDARICSALFEGREPDASIAERVEGAS